MEHKGNVEEKETEVKEKSKIKLSMGNSERKNYNKFYLSLPCIPSTCLQVVDGGDSLQIQGWL